MANVIIGVHGLGNKPPASLLIKWWKLAFHEGLNSGNYDTSLPAFELVYWADIIHEKPLDPAEKDINSPCYISEKYVKAPELFQVEDYSTRRKVIDFLGRQMNRIMLNEDLTLNYSFISDAIISRYFKDLEEYYSETYIETDDRKGKVNELIRNRLRNKLLEHRNDNIMLISHSMGAIVAFDVLTFLVPEIRIDTFITMGAPLGLPVILSKIAAEKKQRGITNTQMTTPPGITGHWYNFSDILDKVAFNYKLSEYYSENTYCVKPIDFVVINKYEINGIRNPHKSFGYLRTPEFSKILNEFIQTEKMPARHKLLLKTIRSINKFRLRFASKKKHRDY
jgi:hypothetical protein